jgi:heat shock protein HslJ
MIKKHQIFVILTLLAVSMSACSSFSSQPDLNGTSWALTQLQGGPVMSTVVPTLVFKDGQVSGNASCNSFGGSYQRGWGDALKFGQLMSTLVACADSSSMEQERVYLSVLGQVAKYRMENDQLFLYNGADQLLIEFKRQ